jgi:hypothetical protein
MRRVNQRETNASMSACIWCLSSSDNEASGFWLSLLCVRVGWVWISVVARLGVVLNVRTGRGFAGFDSVIYEVDASFKNLVSGGIDTQMILHGRDSYTVSNGEHHAYLVASNKRDARSRARALAP